MFDSLHGRVTVFTGFGKGSGKTTAVRTALYSAQRTGPVGVFTIGYDDVGKSSPSMRVRQGDIVITTVSLARAAEARLDIIEALPGRSAIGQLCLGRAVREGTVALVGPEHFSQLAWAIDLIRKNNWADTVLVDGAAGRVTQVSALPDAQFLYCARADAANFHRIAANTEMIAKLAYLPLEEPEVVNGSEHGPNSVLLHVKGPLTESVIETIPKDTTHISIEAFCDCFLNPSLFNRLSQRYKIMVRKRVPLLGFVIAFRNIGREAFLREAPSVGSGSMFNPLEIEVA